MTRFVGTVLTTTPLIQGKDSLVAAIMIEINRKLYVDEATVEPIPKPGNVASITQRVVLELAATTFTDL